MGLFGVKSTDDDEDWTTECRNCGATATNWNFCSDACAEEHWEKSQAHAPRYNTDPDCPVCGGAGSCKLCEDNAE